ncbi:hypothetical protein [Bordetella sp. N]|uniref:hypothetical protein n=1 Tax=Bordetella sp. N TaxID=1746199 RepID=UPI00070F4417|nr:hypothetical protein [Bordetella sp. N]ALM86050.1 hypothetical protein ASB57_26615 [Bordetella sp. N]
MASSESVPHPVLPARRTRWRAVLAVLVLAPCTMAAVGWRDLQEVRRALELKMIDVPAGQTADYNDAHIEFAGLRAIPLEPGLPEDRTFLRARMLVDPARQGTQWLDCKLRVIDSSGRVWTEIEQVPRLVQRTLARPGEPEGTSCKGLAVTQAEPGSKVVIDAYYLVPRQAIPDLRVTLSTMDGRPAYLRFPASPEQ